MAVSVEQGAVNPSVGTLLRLSAALGVGLPALVEPPKAADFPDDVSPTQRRRSEGRQVTVLQIRLKRRHRATAWFEVVGRRPSTPGRLGGLVVAQGAVAGVALVALPAAERAGLTDLIGSTGGCIPLAQ